MPRVFVLVLAVLPIACFNPDTREPSASTSPFGPTTEDPTSITTFEASTSATSATSVADGSDDTSGGTTMPLDGTSTGPGATTDDTTGSMATTSGSTSGESSGEGSSSGTMACTPGPAEVEFESLGDFISQGDAWQSFTADTNGDIVRIDFYWNLSGTNDSFTINVYEGEGIAGALLHSQLFPGQGMGTFVGFDSINVLSTPVPITAGSIYTVQGTDTFGWQTASGAIAGSNSSLGAGQHKNIRVWVEPCE
ncbi:hypothetical protein [Paraliomyxa miuraensis]|uniref:hypothetical protein n=1 Tax=Paraliomyxa miuraensis TaxID=376150 RepID=UPI0022509CDA|nr:hypothetical protein [Paraliomyxa miuraensis]MCX4241261.1 hypothetical protein [Paraliomyxa miuraensis]